MPGFACPRCQKETVLLRDKFRLGLWLTTHCSSCGTRLCANPYLMVVVYFFHIWNVIWWPTIAHFTGNYWNLIYLFPCWLVIELINLNYVPMCCLKKKPG